MKIRTKLFFGFGILLIVILLVTGVAYFNSIKIINSAGGIVHTENVLRTLEEINSQLVDAETGQRGYILTREESYLEPYNEAILKIIENLKYLKELTSDNPVQQKNIEMVEPLIKARLKGLRKTIRLKRNGKDDLVMSIVLENEGKKLMDDIREITSSMKVEENRLLGERSQMPEESRKESNLILLFLFIFGGVVGVGTSFIIARKIANPIKQLQKATEQVGKGNFKVRTNIKTRDEVRQLAIAFDKTTEALERMDEEHKQLEKAKTEFLSITSHELRSPMTPMRAQLQMLLGEYFGKLNTKQKESMKIVLRNTERLDNIIVDFLEISRIEAARLKFNFKKVDPIEGVNCLVEEMNGFLPEKK